jgi:hypothetical protein
MGYGSWGRSPYEVQLDNGKRFDFDSMAKHYEEVKPIRGQRAKYCIKPLSERRRSWERMFKVSDNEYYITCNAWAHDEEQNLGLYRKAISFLKNGDQETIIVHTHRVYWGVESGKEPSLNVNALSNPSTFYFYAFNLPMGLTMAKYRSANYVQVISENGNKFYTLEKGDVTFTRKVGDKYWSPLVVHRESVHTIDRKLSKAVREKAKDFVEYCMLMSPITPEPKNNWWARNTNPFMLTDNGLGGKYNDIRDSLPREVAWETLLTKGEDVPEYWFPMLDIYKQRSQLTWWDHETRTYHSKYQQEKMVNQIYKDLYTIAKPCKEVEVPLGERCKDNYGSWYN